jgi:hypothetical protein
MSAPAIDPLREDSPDEPSSTAVVGVTPPLPEHGLLDASVEKGRPDFCMGDHVYQWCNFMGIPAVFQHHGIVLDTFYHGEDQQWRLRVADFSNWQGEEGASAEEDTASDTATDAAVAAAAHDVHRTRAKSSYASASSSSFGSSADKGGSVQTYETDPALWKKVAYEAGFWRKHLARGGTATGATADPPGIVRARVQFLLDEPHRVPTYNLVHSNCECVAVWCKTGTWGTLQATSWLSATAAGQAKSTVTLLGAASAAQVSVPSAGLWGWLGYTTQVSLMSTQPWILPALATYGAVTVGGPALWLAVAQKHWKQVTADLNTAFWEAAVAHPDIFVEYLTYWSSLHAPVERVGATQIETEALPLRLEAVAVESLPAQALTQLPPMALAKLLPMESSESLVPPLLVTQEPSQAAMEG